MSSKMESFYKLQNDTKLRIEKARSNNKKSPKDRITRSYVEIRLESLESSWKSFVKTHEDIVQEATESNKVDKYFKNELFEETEELYVKYKWELKEMMCGFAKENTSQGVSKEYVKTKNDSIKLPKITIPTFTGDYAQWTTFKDLFVSLIHQNESLDNVQKMHYLKGLLSGEAEQLVRNIPITAANYNECWTMLSSRFDNKRFTSNCLLKRLMSQVNAVDSSSAIKGLLDTTMECLNGLKNLGVDVESWDIIVIHIVSAKLDVESRKLWETKISAHDKLPTLVEFREFLEARSRALEFLDSKSTRPRLPVYKPKVHHLVNADNNANVNMSCPYCKESHKIANCKQFAKESYESRHDFVQTKGLCFNCLGANHSIKYCRQTSSCRVCKRRHHSLLHPKSSSNPAVSNTNSIATAEVKSAVSAVQTALSAGEPSSPNIASYFSQGSVPTQVLLATALVEAQTRRGSTQLLRVLLDQGSQASFITESTVQLLGLKKTSARTVISGIGGEKSSFASRFTVLVTIHSRIDPNFSVQVEAYVLGTITSLLPSEKLAEFNWPEFQITLADPEYHTPNKIDILLGAEVYGQVLREGLTQGPPGFPVAQNTALGWILSGQIPSRSDSNVHCHHAIISSDEVDDNALLKQFWEIESIIPGLPKIFSEDEQRCENIYSQSTSKDESGRYVVHLPFRSDDPQCQRGNSRNLAIKRFQLLENKFKKHPEVKKRYSEVFHEYIDLGHMERVQGDDPKRATGVYLPHHAVVRDDKSTSKVRIVFDASMKGLNGVSLNDDLMVGPTLQPPLRHIIMKWRMHPISICSDIIKMYRQVKVSPEHVDFQRVVWRDDSNDEIEDFRMLRVTFGTSSAPYLAVKTLQQVAVDECSQDPEVAEKIKNEFYVDDLMTGCETLEEGLMLKKKITDVLTKGGFQLQKWISSCKELNELISDDGEDRKEGNDRDQGIREKDIKIDEVMKILGISWDRDSDEFRYSVKLSSQQAPITKRRVISDISRLFDPLGWAAPCVVTSKIFIQKLWLSGIGWDEELPPELLLEWQTYRQNLVETCKFSIPRWVDTSSNNLCVELHGFSDASVVAYAAVVYVRVINADVSVTTGLITARTKVSPVKQQSIPRLELMGATLLADLITEVSEVMRIPQTHVHAWTDSSVVLAWLSSHPSRWTTFVANRVSSILSQFDNSHWAHVQSSQNPADIASRGLTPHELSCNVLWTQGPPWLRNETIEYTRPKAISTNVDQKSVRAHVVTENTQEDPLWTKYSTLQKLVRVVAYCRRVLRWRKLEGSSRRYETYLTKEEIEEATKVCIQQVQKRVFSEEIEDIRKTGNIKARSKLKSLCPMLDSDGILRVSGRIQNARLDADMKHPIILPQDNHFTNLVICEAHNKTLHGGPMLVLNHLRTKYWVISGKTLVKAFVRKCVTCKRYSRAAQTQLMGQLPSSRVIPARPFRNSGVDFAGPVNIRASKGRGHHSYKGYICLFVCMVSKAIHLEAVSDLSAQGFIAGFKRFVGRRGVVSDIWSDNGTNFVGAAKELRHLVAVEKSAVAVDIREWVGNNGTTWHFIPPHAPNFGGLWEAGVKSTKFHLKRVIGNSTLTYEEMSTVLIQVEACLNSRPLSMMPDSPNEPTPLTPGHFLIGEPLITVPDRNYENSNMNTLKRWQLSQRILQEFWRRWSEEYLVHLLQRYKWNKIVPEPNIGDVVLIKEDNLPPARWLLGRIVEKHFGLDNVTRVVTLKCKGSLCKRPVSRLCVLPVTD